MRINREQLLSIANLDLVGRIDSFDDRQLEGYCGQLTAFVEKFPDMEVDFKKALFIGDNERLERVLGELAAALANIHADDLVRECEKVRGIVAGADPDKIEAELISFLSIVATLSVDIQMEQHRASDFAKPKTRRYEVVYAEEQRKIGKYEVVYAEEQKKNGKYEVVYADRQKTVLAVDDIPVTLNILKAVLQEAGYNFFGVTSGAAALDFVNRYTPDLFILDIEMPGMSGFELADALRQRGQHAPLVFLTGNTTRDYLSRAVQVGAVDFLVKPVNAACITAKIKRVLGD